MFNTQKKDSLIKKIVKNNTKIKFVYDKKDMDDYTILVNNKIMFNKIFADPELGLCESYMDGDWDTNNLVLILNELLKNNEKILNEFYKNSLSVIKLKILNFMESFVKKQTIESAKNNIKLHYDVGNDLYKKMLGKTMQYTCAYYNKPGMSLDDAQLAKMQLVAKKLNLKPGMKLIDLGCGFGAMAFYLATNYNVHVLGVTLSQEQVNFANEHYKHPNVKIMYKDYRHVTGKFDRVYSIGMMEHAGRQNYDTLFNKCNNLLKDNGILLIHTIGNKSKIGHNVFFEKYIFPEVDIPHVNTILNSSDYLWNLEDFQNFGLSYAKTLQEWQNNIGDWKGLDNYDTRFRRMWVLYLTASISGFQNKELLLYKFVFTKKTNLCENLYHIRKC